MLSEYFILTEIVSGVSPPKIQKSQEVALDVQDTTKRGRKNLLLSLIQLYYLIVKIRKVLLNFEKATLLHFEKCQIEKNVSTFHPRTQGRLPSKRLSPSTLGK